MSLPVSDKITPRPIYSRWLRRMMGLPMGEPTIREVEDAILIVGQPTRDDMYDEAERTLREWH